MKTTGEKEGDERDTLPGKSATQLKYMAMSLSSTPSSTVLLCMPWEARGDGTIMMVPAPHTETYL